MASRLEKGRRSRRVLAATGPRMVIGVAAACRSTIDTRHSGNMAVLRAPG